MEIWKEVKGFEKRYEISSLGRLRSIKSDKILTGCVTIWGYKRYQLCRGHGKKDHKLISAHRIVAEHFIDNPENKSCVNHINGIKLDNRVENLEWCTYSENIQHAYDTGLKSVPTGKDHWNTKLILNTQTGIFYTGVKEASKTVYFSDSLLTRMLNGILKNRTDLIYV